MRLRFPMSPPVSMRTLNGRSRCTRDQSQTDPAYLQSRSRLRQMALEQAALRQGMEGMAKRMEESGQMSNRLNELADEMENLEAEYLKRHVDERIKEHHREVEHLPAF